MVELDKEINLKNKNLDKDLQKLKQYVDAFKQDQVKDLLKIENPEELLNDNTGESHDQDILNFGEFS